jgi:hypothetical protein
MISIRSYIFYAFLLFGVLIVMTYIDYRLEHFAKESFRFWRWIILKPLLYIPVGAALAIPSFLQNFKKNGVWKIDYKRLLILGIPALYLTFYLPIHFYSPLKVLSFSLLSVLGSELYVLVVGGTILGYIILSSIFKLDDGLK